MLCMLSFKSWLPLHVAIHCMRALRSASQGIVFAVPRPDVMSLSALAPVVIFPCNPGGFQVIDYHGRSSAAVQAASRRLLLPLPVDAARFSRLDAPRCLVEDLQALGGEQHAQLPAFQPGAGLLQLRRDRARIQRMHGELQPSPLAVLRKLPSCDITKRMAPPASLAAVRPAPEAYVTVRQPVGPIVCIVYMCSRSYVNLLSDNTTDPHWHVPGGDAGIASLRGVR